MLTNMIAHLPLWPHVNVQEKLVLNSFLHVPENRKLLNTKKTKFYQTKKKKGKSRLP